PAPPFPTRRSSDLEMLRRKGVVGKFVEFYGPGVANLSLADRATIGNMSPEYGATCAIFPVDRVTLEYLRLTGRPAHRIALVEAYMKEQGLVHSPDAPEPAYSDTPGLELRTGRPTPADPGRPAPRIALVEAYMKEQGLFHSPDAPEPAYSDTLELDLGTVRPSIAGPGRPQDRVPLPRAGESFRERLPGLLPPEKARSAK